MIGEYTKAVREAYQRGKYLDEDGVEWRRGMDGWFQDRHDIIVLIRHHDMVAKINREKPED